MIPLSGKHLEHYLDKVQEATGAKAESLALGDALRLGEGDGSSYEGMFRYNISIIVNSLK
jgi:ABC-type Zn uptake system ZnuABC Zn-binding protein ZnuA